VGAHYLPFQAVIWGSDPMLGCDEGESESDVSIEERERTARA
jgi:hypothetical protein